MRKLAGAPPAAKCVTRKVPCCVPDLHAETRNSNLNVCSMYVELFTHIGCIRMDIDNSGVTWELD
jgi:hypothetical protein